MSEKNITVVGSFSILGFALGFWAGLPAAMEFGKYLGRREFVSYADEWVLDRCARLLRSGPVLEGPSVLCAEQIEAITGRMSPQKGGE